MPIIIFNAFAAVAIAIAVVVIAAPMEIMITMFN